MAKILKFTGKKAAKVLAERDALVETHVYLVRAIANQVSRTLPPSFDIDDLISAGTLGLIRAATTYRPAEHGNAPFEAYARPRVKGSILDSVRNRNYTENTRPSLDDVPEPVSASNIIETEIDNGRLSRKISDAISELPSRMRDVIEMHYTAEMRLADIADHFALSAGRISQLHRQAIEELRQRLG